MNSVVQDQSEPRIQAYPPAKVWTRERNQPFTVKISHWMYDHPTTRKAMKVAAYILGTAVVGAAAFVPTVFATIGLIATGTLVLGITYLASRILKCLVPIRHDMKDLAFRPDKLEKAGKVLGELYYDGLVPILKINSLEPKEAGYTQGYLLQEAISSLRANAEFCIFTLGRQKRPSEFLAVLNTVKSVLPNRFLLELEGMVEGYNAKKGRFEKSICLDDLIYLQLMPDAMYFHVENFKGIAKRQNRSPESEAPFVSAQAVACTLLGLQNQEGAPLIARTMDWASFGIAGKCSLIISRLYETGMRTAEVGIPGLVGTLTGVNSRGVSVAMNVTGYPGKVDTVEGIPSSFYNRMVLEQCASFDEAAQFVASHRALGPYHLTITDPTKSGTFSLYQKHDWTGNWQKDKDNSYCLRLLSNQIPLITTNCSCTPTKFPMFNSRYREEKIKEYLDKNKNIENTKEILKLSQSIPWVNNHLTTHRVLMGHQTLEVAFDNAWAGERALHSVDLRNLFAVQS